MTRNRRTKRAKQAAARTSAARVLRDLDLQSVSFVAESIHPESAGPPLVLGPPPDVIEPLNPHGLAPDDELENMADLARYFGADTPGHFIASLIRAIASTYPPVGIPDNRTHDVNLARRTRFTAAFPRLTTAIECWREYADDDDRGPTVAELTHRLTAAEART